MGDVARQMSTKSLVVSAWCCCALWRSEVNAFGRAPFMVRRTPSAERVKSASRTTMRGLAKRFRDMFQGKGAENPTCGWTTRGNQEFARCSALRAHCEEISTLWIMQWPSAGATARQKGGSIDWRRLSVQCTVERAPNFYALVSCRLICPFSTECEADPLSPHTASYGLTHAQSRPQQTLRTNQQGLSDLTRYITPTFPTGLIRHAPRRKPQRPGSLQIANCKPKPFAPVQLAGSRKITYLKHYFCRRGTFAIGWRCQTA